MKDQRQQGSILIPVLIIAIIIVLVLMWQAGMFSGAASTASNANNLRSDTDSSQTETDMSDVNTDAAGPEPLNAPGPDASPAQIAEYKAANFKPQLEPTADGKGFQIIRQSTQGTSGSDAKDSRVMSETAKAAAIDKAAALLIASNTPDFSACRAADSAEQALECAANKQSLALQNAFQTHNEQRQSGDDFALENSTTIMKKVVENLQESLSPYVEAVDGAEALMSR